MSEGHEVCVAVVRQVTPTLFRIIDPRTDEPLDQWGSTSARLCAERVGPRLPALKGATWRRYKSTLPRAYVKRRR